MGVQNSLAQNKKVSNSHPQARIQGLYEMYNESIRLSRLIKSPSWVTLSGQNASRNTQKALHKKKSHDFDIFLEQLLYSFEQKNSYSWGKYIPELFKKHFKNDFYQEWNSSKQLFYELLLQNSGIEPKGDELLSKSHLKVNQSKVSQSKISHLQVNSALKTQKLSVAEGETSNSFEDYFLKILRQRFKFNFRSSVFPSDYIDRNQEEDQNHQIEVQRLTVEEELNYINCSIIDAEEDKNQIKQANLKPHQEEEDDQHFLPLITKRLKHKKAKPSRMTEQISQYAENQRHSNYENEAKNMHQIQMSKFQSKAKYSKHRIQSSSIILPNTIFYDRMNFSAKVQTDQLLRIYRQVSNTIQQTINSCNLISCPLKHFLFYFNYKTSKKKINQVNQSTNISSVNTSHQDLSQQFLQNRQKTKKIPSKKQNSSFSYDSSVQNYSNLQAILIQTSQKSQVIRKKRQFNTNMLLKQIKEFAEAYTQFLFRYLNFVKIQETDLQKFINPDTVYGIVLKNIWNIVSWLAERGYQWEQHAIKEVVKMQTADFVVFTEEQINTEPEIILRRYANFIGKDISKVKIDPLKLRRAYFSLIKLKNELTPQKYLKKIIVFYRQSTSCCQGADDLMNVYEFLLKNAILSDMTSEMHIFRMKNLIQKLIPIQSSNVDGAGQIVYAWTTWNIILEMFLLKLNQYRKSQITKSGILKKESIIGESNQRNNNIQTQKKSFKKKPGIKQNSSSSQTKKFKQGGARQVSGKIIISSENPEKKHKKINF